MEGVSCHVPTGAFYVFPKVDVPGMNSEEVAMALLEGGVLCSPGSAFGKAGEGHLRFAYTIGRDDISQEAWTELRRSWHNFVIIE